MKADHYNFMTNSATAAGGTVAAVLRQTPLRCRKMLVPENAGAGKC
jgi:hypothetical protein